MLDNIKKFYFYRGFYSFVFFASTSVLFLQSKGLNLTQVTLVFSAYSATAFIFDVPGGIFADKYGKKTSLVIGTFFTALSFGMNAFSGSFFNFIIAALVGGLGGALIGGADSAFIHASLTSENKNQQYAKVQGKVSSIGRVTNAAGLFIGGFLFAINHALPFLLSTVTGFISFFISLTFTSPSSAEHEVRPSVMKTLTSSVSIIKNHHQLLWITIYYSLFTAIIWSMNVMIQPYMRLIGIPVQFFGIAFASIALLSAGSSVFFHRLQKYHSEGFLLMILGIVATIMILMGLKPNIFIFILWGLVDVSSVLVDILVSGKILEIVHEKQAATVLSFQTFGIRMINIISSPILGWISDKHGLPVGVGLSGGFLMTIVVILFLFKESRTNAPR